MTVHVQRGSHGGYFATAAGAGGILLLLFLLLSSRSESPGSAALALWPSQPDSAATILRNRVAESPGAELRIGNDPLHSSAEVRRFYGGAGHGLVWSQPERLLPVADRLARLIERAEDEGLLAQDYHADRIRREVERLRLASSAQAPLPAAVRADLDLLLTDAFLTYGGHLLKGRIDPRQVHSSWTLAGREADLVAELRAALATGDVEAAFARLRPASPAYAALQQALQRYRRVAENGGWEAIPAGPSLRQGDTGSRVAALRRRLAAEAGTPVGNPSTVFDLALADAVRGFQSRYGLGDDGVIGPGTLAALNVSAAARVQQIELNLERLRWLPADLGRVHVEVSIPAFDLEVREEGRTVLQMRVIGGEPGWPTPVFSGQMNSVVLSPYWNIPPNITAQEVIPKVRRDPSYLARNEIRVLAGGGANERQINPASINWQQVNARGVPYRFRQEPGPRNPLGGVKFLFPNPHHVYLHDTPARELFSRPQRAFSHGCMRVEKPLDLAEYLLRSNPAWTRETMLAAIAARRERWVPLGEPVPVHIFYRTAWVDPSGAVQFRADIYGHDRRLAGALRSGPETAAAAEQLGGCEPLVQGTPTAIAHPS